MKWKINFIANVLYMHTCKNKSMLWNLNKIWYTSSSQINCKMNLKYFNILYVVANRLSYIYIYIYIVNRFLLIIILIFREKPNHKPQTKPINQFKSWQILSIKFWSIWPRMRAWIRPTTPSRISWIIRRSLAPSRACKRTME